jgi:hypothetical protein
MITPSNRCSATSDLEFLLLVSDGFQSICLLLIMSKVATAAESRLSREKTLISI